MDERLTVWRVRYFRAACALGALAVMCGAFGAHGLESRLDSQHLEYWHTAVAYHFYHVVPLFALALLAGERWNRWASRACGAWVFGITIFSGTLYLLAVTGERWLGAITPIGGVALIAGWLCALGALVRR
jgi:uncharacterized membrane protein YgdD (TMEM256/DUF423 family)